MTQVLVFEVVQVDECGGGACVHMRKDGTVILNKYIQENMLPILSIFLMYLLCKAYK